MFKLVAQAEGLEEAWERPVPDRPIKLGRAAPPSDWEAGWDARISRWHATLQWRNGQLHVKKAPQARSEIFYQGQAQVECQVREGEPFVIGRTVFTVEKALAPVIEPTVRDQAFEAAVIRKAKFLNAEQQIEALAKLFETIRYSPEEEMEDRILAALLAGVPRADVAALLRLEPANESGIVQVPHFRKRREISPDPRPSRRFVVKCLSDLRRSLVHSESGPQAASGEYTQMAHYNWATCVPVLSDPEPGWGLYYSGRTASAAEVADELHASDLRFVELLGDVCGYVRQMRCLQQMQGLLNPLVSPAVRSALAGKEVDQNLEPRTCQVTVLFCDLRGSCRIAEENEHDLPRLWERISEALTIMTSNIVDHGGVIGDFQGDAAMGFWGWPFANEDQVEQACRAALAIRKKFEQESKRPNRPLSGFACGIGIASGPAMAGKLGTPDQFKISVYGPVVNLAARLESMTKMFGAQILLDEAAAQGLPANGSLPGTRIRPLGRIQPCGMQKVFEISELLPPRGEQGDTNIGLLDYEAALKHFQSGRWSDASKLLERRPKDGPARFLLNYINNQPEPPQSWDGVIRLESK
jgi:adenylate cyclase